MLACSYNREIRSFKIFFTAAPPCFFHFGSTAPLVVLSRARSALVPSAAFNINEGFSRKPLPPHKEPQLEPNLSLIRVSDVNSETT